MPLSACLYNDQHFTGRAQSTFSLLHSVFGYKMLLIKAGNPLRMHAATELHQWHNWMHQFQARKGNQIEVTIGWVQYLMPFLVP